MAVSTILAVDPIGIDSISRYGSEEQTHKYLPPLVQGRDLCGWSFTEAATGSDPRAITSKAIPKGDHYILTGEKTFASLASIFAEVIIFVKDETERVGAFIVEANSPGFKIERHLNTMGIRGCGTHSLTFDGVQVPQENLLGEKGEGFRVLVGVEAMGKVAVAAMALGTSQSALDISVNYAKERLFTASR
jgi:hypothetical protein